MTVGAHPEPCSLNWAHLLAVHGPVAGLFASNISTILGPASQPPTSAHFPWPISATTLPCLVVLQTWIKAASSAAAPGAAAPAAAATQIMAATPSNMQALPTKGQDMQMLPPKGMQMLPGKGKEMQMLPPKGMQALPGKGKDMQMLPSKKDGKSGKGGGKGGKDDKKIFVIPKPAAAAPAPATPASPATPTPVAPVVLPPHLQSAKPETMKLECSFHPVTQQLALSLLHNHCGLIDLQNRKQVSV